MIIIITFSFDVLVLLKDSLDNEDSLNIEDDITGMKCRISYTQVSWET